MDRIKNIKYLLIIIFIYVLIGCKPEPPYICLDGTKMNSLDSHHDYNQELLKIHKLKVEYGVITDSISKYQGEISVLRYNHDIEVNNIKAETQYKIYN